MQNATVWNALLFQDTEMSPHHHQQLKLVTRTKLEKSFQSSCTTEGGKKKVMCFNSSTIKTPRCVTSPQSLELHTGDAQSSYLYVHFNDCFAYQGGTKEGPEWN